MLPNARDLSRYGGLSFKLRFCWHFCTVQSSIHVKGEKANRKDYGKVIFTFS